MPSTHRLQLENGGEIAVQSYEPAGAPRASIIVPCAMGVAQHYYAPFAEWLAAQGLFAVTFDYRGIGLSAPTSLRGFQIDLFAWAQQDCAAVIEYAKARAGEKSLYWVGHSLGGQLFGLIPNRHKIDRAMTVAAGSGYWLDNTWQTKRVVWWLWFVAVPIALAVAGYFPGRRMRKVGDLPKGVMAQWRRWCLAREYVVGAEGDEVRAAYAAVQIPLLSLSFTDDELMSERSIRSLHALYARAPVEHRRIAPQDIGATRIGHFGFFRPQFERSLWPLVTDWIDNG